MDKEQTPYCLESQKPIRRWLAVAFVQVSVHRRENNDIFHGTSWTHYRWGMTQTMVCICSVSSSHNPPLGWAVIAPALYGAHTSRTRTYCIQGCWKAMVDSGKLRESKQHDGRKNSADLFFLWCKLHEKKVWSLNNWILQQGKHTFSYQCKENISTRSEG